MSLIKRFFTAFVKIGVIALTFMVSLEGALRLYPEAIPVPLLADFETHTRSAIAKRLELPTESDQVVVKRDDRGPRLSIFAPNQVIRSQYRDPGIVNDVKMDERGFCNPPRGNPAQSDVDIVAIGDSFTWCTNVHPIDTWAARLGSLLGKSVDNLGRPRTGLYEYIQIFKTFGLKEHPKLVVLNIYEGNDLRDAIIHVGFATGHGDTTAHDLAVRSLSTVGRYVEWARTGWVAQNSYTYNLVFVSMIQGFEWVRRSVIPRDPKAVSAGAPDFRYDLRFGAQVVPFNPENADPDEVVHARAVASGSIRTDPFEAALDTIGTLSQEHNFALLVTYTPSAYTAYAEFVRFRDPSLAPIMAKYSTTLRQYFAVATAKRGIAFLDLSPALQEAARKLAAGELLYYQTTVHLTAAGHRVVSETIAKKISNDLR